DGERELPLPALRHFVGSERGDPGSRAFVSVAGDGSIHGWLQRGGVIEAFSRQPGDRKNEPLRLKRVDMQAADASKRQFSCGSDELAAVPPDAESLQPVAALPAGSTAGPLKLARVAIDTDDLYLDK